MKKIVLGTSIVFDILGNGETINVVAFPISPSANISLVDDDYLVKANRLGELEAKEELTADEQTELAELQRELGEKMDSIAYAKLSLMLHGEDTQSFLDIVKEYSIESYALQIVEEALKKTENESTER